MAANSVNKVLRINRFYFILLVSCAILVISACGSTQVTSISPATQPKAPVNTTPPTSITPLIPIPLPLPTDTSAATETKVSTVACFTTYYDPFAFLPGGRQLLVRANNGVQIFDLESMKEVKFISSPSSLNNPVVALSPDGEKLAWALEDGTIQILRIADQSVAVAITSGQAVPLKLEFSPAGDKLYSMSHDKSVKIWDIDGNLIDAFLPGFDMVNIGISPDGSLLATIPSDGPVRLWGTADLKWVKDLGGTGGYDTSDAAFSPNGQYLASDLVSGLFVWDVAEGSSVFTATTPINSVSVAYSPDGRYLAYGNLNDVVLSALDGMQVARTLSGHQAPVFALVFSPDSSLLVSADDREIRVWRVDDGQLLAIGKSSCP